MKPSRDAPPNKSNTPRFAANAFAGTANYYARYRVPYPEELLTDLFRRANVSSNDKLLDLACGPGRVALALSRSFDVAKELLAYDSSGQYRENMGFGYALARKPADDRQKP
jgi:hypothetical protein